MQALRRGDCPNCTHSIVDPRDLKFYRNVCGFHFADEDDRFQWRGKLCLARWGLAELIVYGGGLAVTAAVLVAVGLVVGATWLAYAAVVPGGLALFILSFFRDPVRQIPAGSGVVVSPADGTIDDIEELAYCEHIDGPAVKIGIFLSVFSVHVNRSPERNRVIEVRYLRGKFGNALRRETAQENEQTWLFLECEESPYRRLVVKQIVGAIARRIVCEVRPGEVLQRGQKFGMIKFGSRTELYLPKEGLCVEVKINQSVRGGASTIARYAEAEPSTP
jgi:phosphatidylserine decarboxylase